MRIYIAKKTISIPEGFEDRDYVYKGQMFYLDTPTDLPYYEDPSKPEHKEYWQELEFYNNYGTVRLQGKI